MLLGFTEQRQFTYALLWVRHNPFEQGHKMTDHPFNRGRIEQVSTTGHVTMKTLVLLFHVQFKVEAGYARIDLQLLHFQTPQPKLACSPMPQGKRRLKERMLVDHAAGLEFFDQALRRTVLTDVGFYTSSPDAPDQFANPRVPRQVGPQHQHLEKKADSVVQRCILPPRDWNADTNVILRTITA